MFNFFKCLFHPNKPLTYNAAIKLVYDNNIHTLRSRIKILIVDDEEFDIVQILRERKYDIYYKKDMTYALEAEPFDIIIIDIKGVGSALGGNMGGFAVAEEIKQRYPAKQVICYSASVVMNEVLSKLVKIDGYISKDTGVDAWCEKLDGIITTYCSRDYQINKLREQLKACNVSEENIANVVKEYNDNLEGKNFTSVINRITSLVDNPKVLFSLIKFIYSSVEYFAS